MSTSHDPKPDWQTDTCPVWCVVDHRREDLPEDRIHDSRGDAVAVTVTPPGLEGDIDDPEATEFIIRTSRLSGQHTDWTFIGEEHRHRQHVQLSRESAHRLADALTKHLASLG